MQHPVHPSRRHRSDTVGMELGGHFSDPIESVRRLNEITLNVIEVGETDIGVVQSDVEAVSTV